MLDDLLGRAPERGAALVVRGEAGIGKTTLLAAATRRARDRGMQILFASGLQTETHLPFAGLHQLLSPIMTRVDELPPRQRAAIGAAFGTTDAPAPDPFLTALASLSLLGDAAADAPLLLIAEDAQWLDRPTGDVLTFIARRLESDPIVMLAAIRDGYESPLLEAGLAELHLGGLEASAARALLEDRVPDVVVPELVAPQLREQVLTEAAGNPLALVELSAVLPAEQPQYHAPLPAPLPLTTRLERAFSTRASALPAASRALLLLAAADDGGVLAEIAGAAPALLGGDVRPLDALEPAVAAGLVEIDGFAVRFRHPLMRSAILQAASESERRAAHAALAAVLADQPDRRAWHRASATAGPDEEAAAGLEAAAGRALRRGGIAAAVTALEQAARLCVEPEARTRRLLTAAELSIYLGRDDLARRLTRDAESTALHPSARRRLAFVRMMVSDSPLSDAVELRLLIDNAEDALGDGDTDMALNFLWLAASRCYWTDPGWATRERLIGVAERIAVPGDDPRLIAILAFAAPLERGAAVIERVARRQSDGGLDGLGGLLLYTAASVAGALELGADMMATVVAALRAEGRLSLLLRALSMRAWCAIQMMDLRVAVPIAEEADRLGRETGERMFGAVARAAGAMLAAIRGDQDAAGELLAYTEQIARSYVANALRALVQLVRGVAALAVGRSADAYAHLLPMFDPAGPAFSPVERGLAIGYFVDAAVQSGHRDQARDVFHAVEAVAAQTPSPAFHQRLRYARPLLADDADAEALYLGAIAEGPTQQPFLRAGLQLAFGEWLQRRRRIAESRSHLRAARDTFDALGVPPWAERARQALRAAGESSRRHTPNALDLLTAQELQIAQLAAEGLSNREIGQKLFLSHRTVGSHLYRIFPKLGITARSELRDALDAGTLSPVQ